ncbi:hypothetical protein SUGI_0926090 [Cryptomeria japonica]|nr:hypothetical protein SUGI_0926090 [Cryptomeria japonica]
MMSNERRRGGGGGGMNSRAQQKQERGENAAAVALLLRLLPSLTMDMCDPCARLLQDRANQLASGKGENWHEQGQGQEQEQSSSASSHSCISEVLCSTGSNGQGHPSWADIAQEEEEEEEVESARQQGQGMGKRVLSRDEREYFRFMRVGRKKDYACIERVNGRPVNIVQGLELHTGVFSAAEQKRIVDFIYQVQQQGRNKQLKERTYSEPRKWMKGKGRVTIQFGCCYNYAVDRNGNPPGIIRDEEVDPIPPLFKTAIRRLVRWHVLPPDCIPDSCIVNIYEQGDCIPPHIDHHDFVRPFCTVSFLSECNIIFGSNLKILGPGEFAGSIAIPLPVGSVLILSGNGADVAKHSVPAVPSKRISITFRKMDQSKLPYYFAPEPDMQGIEPLLYTKHDSHTQSQQPSHYSVDSRI